MHETSRTKNLGSEPSSLARSRQKVFLSADALGLLADLSCARCAAAVARARAHDEAARHAVRQRDGAAGALRFDHRFPVAGRRYRGLARLGAWLHGAAIGTHLPRA